MKNNEHLIRKTKLKYQNHRNLQTPPLQDIETKRPHIIFELRRTNLFGPGLLERSWITFFSPAIFWRQVRGSTHFWKLRLSQTVHFAMVVFELESGGIGMVRHPDVAQSKEHIKGFHLA